MYYSEMAIQSVGELGTLADTELCVYHYTLKCLPYITRIAHVSYPISISYHSYGSAQVKVRSPTTGYQIPVFLAESKLVNHCIAVASGF